MEGYQIQAKVEKIFKAWDLGSHNFDDGVVSDIQAAIREALNRGYEKGFKACKKKVKEKFVDVLVL
jgi:hypothetical protein